MLPNVITLVPGTIEKNANKSSSVRACDAETEIVPLTGVVIPGRTGVTGVYYVGTVQNLSIVIMADDPVFGAGRRWSKAG